MTTTLGHAVPAAAHWTDTSHAGTHWARSLRLVADRLVGPDGAPAAPSVAVQGPGGTGKTLLLAELAAAYRAAGVPVADAAGAGPAVPGTGDVRGNETRGVAVLVDDGQRLPPDTCRRLRDLVLSRRAQVTLAYRPAPHLPELTELVEAMGSDRHLVVLSHLEPDQVQRWATAELGPAATPDLVGFVVHQTGGLPVLVDALLRALAGTRQNGRPTARTVPTVVVDRVRAEVAALDDADRSLLHALAAGSPLDAEVLGDVLELSARESAHLMARARGGGLLLGEGTVVPLVHQVLLDGTPADITRRVRRRLLGTLLDRGEDPLAVARSLAADRVRDPRAARVLEEQGTSTLVLDPGLAGELLGDAVASGAPVGRLAARRATAAALTGDLDGALLWADRALGDDSAPDRSRAAGVAAAVLARRGMLARSVELCRLAGPAHAGSTALALVAVGRAEEAAACLQATDGPPGHRAATMLAGSERLMAEGVLQSVRPGATASDSATALSTLTRAATLLEPAGPGVLLLDTPAALAALLALHSGELTAAESVLDRALDADVGGRPCRPRHLLLRAWTAMLRGSGARAFAARAQAEAGGTLEPRDELFLRTLEVALARRASDAPALATAWEGARQAALRHPIDLFTLLPLGELVVAGTRLAEAERLEPYMLQANALLARLGQPAVWSAPLHWSGAQAAILADDPAALEPHATALVAAARTSRYAAAVATAGRCWLRLLAGHVDATAVVSAATGLAGVGLAWDGSRLAGQAAARAVDAHDRLDLLHCARGLSATEEPAPSPAGDPAPAPVPTPAGRPTLSQRERDVAELVLAGLTYREVGARLYLSPKTVEHHVSRMRQRLGASTRSDLLSRLRAGLQQPS